MCQLRVDTFLVRYKFATCDRSGSIHVHYHFNVSTYTGLSTNKGLSTNSVILSGHMLYLLKFN